MDGWRTDGRIVGREKASGKKELKKLTTKGKRREGKEVDDAGVCAENHYRYDLVEVESRHGVVCKFKYSRPNERAPLRSKHV